MPLEMLYLIILVGASLLFITEWLSMEVTALLIMVSLALAGILSPAESLAGFSNPATVTVGAMFVLSAGLVRTGALENLTLNLAEFSQGKSRRLLILLGIAVPLASAFINNTPVVAMMVPVIISLALRYEMALSKLLIPVSYFAILGGTLTLIGTSTNILVNELKVEAGQPAFGLFDFAPLGIIFLGIGGTLIIFLSDRLLPDTPGASKGTTIHQVYLARFRVPTASTLVGRRASDVFDRVQPTSDMHLQLSSVRRLQPTGNVQAPAVLQLLAHRRTDGSLPTHLAEDEEVEAQDQLLVSGEADAVIRFQSQHSLAPDFGRRDRRAAFTQAAGDRLIIQAVVLSDSTLIGHSLATLDALDPYAVRLLGYMLPDTHTGHADPERELRSGDALLLEGTRDSLNSLRDRYRLILIEERVRMAAQFRNNNTALVILAGVILAGAFSGQPFVLVALAGALAMIGTGCLTLQEAFRSLNSRTLMLLVGTIPLGLGMQAAGIIDPIVEFLLQSSWLTSLTVTVGILYLLASVLTQLISNAAVAVLFVPIALGLAQSLQIDPLPLIMAIAFGASASFMSPTGYQTNAIVMEPGGYSYADYLRLGVPLQIAMWVVATLCIPWIYA